MGRLRHLSDLGTVGGLHHDPVASQELKTGGIEIIRLGSVREDDPYDIGH